MVTGKLQCQCHMMTCFNVYFFPLSEAYVQRLKCAGRAITVIISVSPRVAHPSHEHEMFLSCYGTHVYSISFKSYSCSIIHRVATA